jgi:hypothetical protein
MNVDESGLPSAVIRATISAATSAAGLGVLDPLLQLVVEPLGVEMARRRSVALRAAESLAGCSREELADRLQSDPASVDRLVRLLYAAGMNGNDELLAMMGESLVRGLLASERADAPALAEEEAILDSISLLAPRHIKMLTIVRAEGPISNIDLGARVIGWDRYPDLTESQLLQAGLVENPFGRWAGDDGADRFYELSALGILVLEAASQYQARA